MLIFLDFDDVLFNTKEFKNDYFKLFEAEGISREVFDKFYYTFSGGVKVAKYYPQKHLDRIFGESNPARQNFEKKIIKFISNTEKYIFKDVKNFLENFSSDNLCVLSFSKTDFQKSKIMNSGIAKYFSQIEITNQLKGGAMAEILKNKKADKIYFVDDRAEHIKDAKIKNDGIIAILLKRKEGRYNDKKNQYCDFEAHNLGEVLKIIKSK